MTIRTFLVPMPSSTLTFVKFCVCGCGFNALFDCLLLQKNKVYNFGDKRTYCGLRTCVEHSFLNKILLLKK